MDLPEIFNGFLSSQKPEIQQSEAAGTQLPESAKR